MSTGRRLLQSAPFQPIFTHRGQAKTRKKTEKLFTEIQSEIGSGSGPFPATEFADSFFPTVFAVTLNFSPTLERENSGQRRCFFRESRRGTPRRPSAPTGSGENPEHRLCAAHHHGVRRALVLFPIMLTPSLSSTIQALLTPGKGILAADESFPTIGKRFQALGIESTEENRRTYRELLFTAPGLSEAISGVILFDETIRQKTSAGLPLPNALAQQGIIPGIKVDRGTMPLPRCEGEKLTEGLDGLRTRLEEYRTLGARFTKWRAVLSIGPGRPSVTALAANARALALFAVLSQDAGLVPIVEPEVLMDGDHTLERCEETTGEVLRAVFEALQAHHADLEGLLLKTAMVLSGAQCPAQAGLAAVAEATLRCLRRHVPAAVPGIVFLSGGQDDRIATDRLAAICTHANRDMPWTLSFSFGRALQTPALQTWHGSAAEIGAAQAALLECTRRNGQALRPS